MYPHTQTLLHAFSVTAILRAGCDVLAWFEVWQRYYLLVSA